MKHPNKTTRPTPASRPRRFKTSPGARRHATFKPAFPPAGENNRHDLLVLCFYPGMGPDDRTAA